MDERRKFIRVPSSLKVDYNILKDFRSVTSEANDISLGGIRFSVLQPLRPGVILELKIYIPEINAPLECTGKVVWQKKIVGLHFPYTIGLQFLQIREQDRKKLLEYINSKSSSD